MLWRLIHRAGGGCVMLRRLLDRELGVAKHNDRLGRPPQRIYLLQRPYRQEFRNSVFCPKNYKVSIETLP